MHCPEHTVLTTVGSSASSDCVADAGWTGAGTTEAVCAAGKFRSAVEAISCTECPVNSKTAGLKGSTAVSACAADAGHTGSGKSVTKCAADSFKAAAGAEACTACRANSETAGAMGSTASTDCVAVPTKASASGSPNKPPNNVTADKDILRPNGRDFVVVIMVTVAVVGVMVAGGLSVYSCCLKPEATLETKAPETSV